MKAYQPRTIRFSEIIQVNEWNVKVYTIAKTGASNHPEFYKNAVAKLPEWLVLNNSFDASHEKMAFLILHAGTEGFFSLINWWVGKNMLNTHVFITEPEQPHQFKKISGDGLFACIWELEVINHERISWTNYIIKQALSPDYNAYLRDQYNGEI